MEEVSKDIVQAWVADLRWHGNNHRKGRELSSGTVRQCIAKFRIFWRYLIEERSVAILDPCARISVDYTPVRKKKVFNDLARKKLLIAAGRKYGWLWETLFLLYFESLCRRGELAGLKWRYVDFKNKRFYVVNTLIVDYQRNVIEKPFPKTENSEDWVPLSDDMCQRLLKLKAIQESSDPAFCSNSYVFREGYRGGTWDKYIFPEFISARFRYACKMAGLKNYTLHGTRKTGFSRLVNKGVDPMVVASIGRWKNPKVPSQHYYQVDELTKSNVMKQKLFS